MIFIYQFFKFRFRSLRFILRRSRINHGRCKHLTRSVYDRNLTPRSVRRIEPHGNFIFHWRLHQKRTKVYVKHLNRLFLRVFGKQASYFSFNRGLNQSFIRVGNGILYVRGCNAFVFHEKRLANPNGKSVVYQNFNLKIALGFSPVYRKNSVRFNLRDVLRIVGVHLVRFCRIVFGFGKFSNDLAVFKINSA